MFHSYSFLWPWTCATRVQLRGSNFIAELVADDNDAQKSSAISIKNFNEIMDDVKSATSPALIEVEEDEEVSVSSLVSPHYLSFFRLLF
jgi:hypothetical protein